MDPISTDVIREDFETQIKGISPTFAQHQDKLWRPVDSPTKVEGAALRRFYLMIVPGTPDGELYGGPGISKGADGRVYTAYTGLPPKGLEGLIDNDGHDLYLTFERRTSPTLSGLLPPTHQGWVELNSEEGAVWGYHQFLIQYLAEGSI